MAVNGVIRPQTNCHVCSHHGIHLPEEKKYIVLKFSVVTLGTSGHLHSLTINMAASFALVSRPYLMCLMITALGSPVVPDV